MLQFPMQNYQEESFGGKRVSPIQVLPISEVTSGQKLSEIDGVTGFTVGDRRKPAFNGENSRLTISPELRFVKSERTLTASGHDSILEIAEQEGIQIRNACRTGSCGACKTRILQGNVRYDVPPTALSEADQKAGYALACVAYPEDNLEIEA
jgi:ferredoxin